jgi:hypothetical protein
LVSLYLVQDLRTVYVGKSDTNTCRDNYGVALVYLQQQQGEDHSRQANQHPGQYFQPTHA